MFAGSRGDGDPQTERDRVYGQVRRHAQIATPSSPAAV